MENDLLGALNAPGSSAVIHDFLAVKVSPPSDDDRRDDLDQLGWAGRSQPLPETLCPGRRRPPLRGWLRFAAVLIMSSSGRHGNERSAS